MREQIDLKYRVGPGSISSVQQPRCLSYAQRELVVKMFFEEGESCLLTQLILLIFLNFSRHDSVSESLSTINRDEMFMLVGSVVDAPCSKPYTIERMPPNVKPLEILSYSHRNIP